MKIKIQIQKKTAESYKKLKLHLRKDNIEVLKPKNKIFFK